MPRLFILLCTLLTVSLALANGPCPDGQFNPGPQVCMCPGGGYVGPNQYCGKPERYLRPTWGAFVVDPGAGSIGSASSTRNQQDANNMALKKCEEGEGAKNCQVAMTFKNTCAAMAWGRTAGVGRGTSGDTNNRAEAERQALAQCQQSGDPTCKVRAPGYCAGAKNW